MGLLITVLQILFVIGCAALAWYVIIWFLGFIGIAVPEKIVVLVLVLLVIAAIIGILGGGLGWPKIGRAELLPLDTGQPVAILAARSRAGPTAYY